MIVVLTTFPSDIDFFKRVVKHDGGHLIVWGCMSYNGVGNLTFIVGIMNVQMYIDVLRDNLQQSAITLGI